MGDKILDSKAFKDGLQRWNEYFHEERRQALREETHRTTKRIMMLLDRMFPPDGSGGWESWILQTCGDDVCAHAIGIPSYYDKNHLRQLIITPAEEMSPSVGEVVQTRINISLNMLIKIFDHFLAPRPFERFQKVVTTVRDDMLVDEKHSKKWGDIDYLRVWQLLEKFTAALKVNENGKDNGSEALGHCRLEARLKLRSYRRSFLDREFYPLLIAIGKARGARDPKRWDDLRRCLIDLGASSVVIETDVVAWWAVAEILYESDRSTLKALDRSGFVDRILAKDLDWPVDDEESFESSNLKGKLDVIFAVPSVLAWLDFSGHAAEFERRADFREEAWRRLEEGYGVPASEEGGPSSAQRGHLFADDRGRLAVMASRLLSLLEFWRWQTVYETFSCLSGGSLRRLDTPRKGEPEGKSIETTRFGELANSPRSKGYFTWPIWRKLEGLPRLYAPKEDRVHGLGETSGNWLSQSIDEITELEGTKFSVMLMGGPGIGKTAIVKELWKVGIDNCIERTPFEMDANWLNKKVIGSLVLKGKDRKGKTQECSFFLVFVDEIHLPTKPSPYGLLLKPIQEGFRKDYLQGAFRTNDYSLFAEKNRVVFAFATSAYVNKNEFLEAAYSTKDIAMRDFAERIGEWVELPELSTVVEQKALVAYALAKGRFEKAIAHGAGANLSPRKLARKCAIYFTLNLKCRSIRQIVSEIMNPEFANDGAGESFIADLVEDTNSYYPDYLTDGVIGQLIEESNYAPRIE